MGPHGDEDESDPTPTVRESPPRDLLSPTADMPVEVVHA